MESQKPKIALYKKRSFGDKLNASFDFIKENWKIILKFTTYLLLPLSLIQALSLNGLMGGVFSIMQQTEGGNTAVPAMSTAFFINYGAYFLLTMIGTMLLSSLLYGLIHTYNEREERLQGVTLGMLKPLLFRNLKKMLVILLMGFALGILIVLVLVILIVLTPFTLIFTIPAAIAVMLPFALWTPIYLLEEITVIGALKKAFRLGFATWGGIFLMALVMGLVANILQGVTMMPWYIATLVKYFFAMSDAGSGATVSVGYSFFLYILGIIQTFGVYLAMIFSVVGLVYQYGHASEVVDSVTVEDDIDKFNEL